MTAVSPPSYLQGQVGYNASNNRKLLAALLLGGAPANVDGGVLPYGAGDALAVAPAAAPNNTVTVAAGVAVIPDTSGGAYVGIDDGPAVVPITSANVTNPRLDLIVARVYDSERSGTLNEFRIEAVTGTPSANPVVPAVPPLAIPLAEVRVPASTTTVITGAAITSRRRASSLRGAPSNGPTSQRPTPRMAGQLHYDTDLDGMFETSKSLAWRRISHPAVSVDGSGNLVAANLPKVRRTGKVAQRTAQGFGTTGDAGTFTVPFPAGSFTTPPNLQITAEATYPSLSLTAGPVTKDNFQVHYKNTNNRDNPFIVHWQAEGT